MKGPSCTSEPPPEQPDQTRARAVPAIRIKALIDSFTETGGDVPGQFVGLCGADFGSVPAELGHRVIEALTKQCIRAPVLTPEAAVACAPGEDLGGRLSCPAEGCLDRADCMVVESVYAGVDATARVPSSVVQKCPSAIFNDPSLGDCDATCPCWRLAVSPRCDPSTDGTPYALEILRKDGKNPPPGTYVELHCRELCSDPASRGSAPTGARPIPTATARPTSASSWRAEAADNHSRRSCKHLRTRGRDAVPSAGECTALIHRGASSVLEALSFSTSGN